VHGNAITEADQWGTLELVVNLSRQVWSDVTVWDGAATNLNRSNYPL
jgi:hypothetical protein